MFLNPVLTAMPWYRNSDTLYGDPKDFHSQDHWKSTRRMNRKKYFSPSLPKRHRNIETLLERFPDIKKYQANAALSMTRNDLPKAIVLLEVLECCESKEPTEESVPSNFIQKIKIHLHCDKDGQVEAQRNIAYEDSSDASNMSGRTSTISFQDSLSENSNSSRIGVIIKRTKDGYQSSSFD